MPESLIEQRDVAGVRLVVFRDEAILDVFQVQQLTTELHALVEQPGVQRVVLDFTRVRFLSSQALGMLLTLRRKALQAGVNIAIGGVGPTLAQIFEITNIDKLFATHAEAAAALAAVGASPGAQSPPPANES